MVCKEPEENSGIMKGRNRILKRIWQNKPETKPLPEIFMPNITALESSQLLTQFTEALKKVGAEVANFASREEIQAYIQSNFQNPIDLLSQEVKKKYAGAISNLELEKTEFLFLEGQFGVVENGAIWVDETNFPSRLLPFVTPQLMIVLDKTKLVWNIHEAYQKINIHRTGFGVFISGPSKTADIEQSLVYGAHGAKELVVLIY